MAEFNYHKPVMLKEVLSFVDTKRPITYVDMTLGRAGHAQEILSIAKKQSKFIGVDKDLKALEFSKNVLSRFEKKAELNYLHAPYSKAVEAIKNTGVKGADFILMDIGVSSPQFDDPSRGFSYRFDAPLDMRMDQTQNTTARDIVNTASEKELVHIFRDLGECSIYYPVVKRILAERESNPIETTFQLVDIIKQSLPAKELRKAGHPAKQFFLGLRYEVNGEINELREGLVAGIEFLNPHGRLVIISFNSEEDKIVKETFKKYVSVQKSDKYHPLLNEKEPSYIALTKKPLVPSEDQIEDNNRSKPSILRAIERR
ncbi:MAG: 16S rRNA (cytosine(1402)-N(4))-methyltransferase RsmH [Bacilli bacterium]